MEKMPNKNSSSDLNALIEPILTGGFSCCLWTYFISNKIDPSMLWFMNFFATLSFADVDVNAGKQMAICFLYVSSTFKPFTRMHLNNVIFSTGLVLLFKALIVFNAQFNDLIQISHASIFSSFESFNTWFTNL